VLAAADVGLLGLEDVVPSLEDVFVSLVESAGGVPSS